MEISILEIRLDEDLLKNNTLIDSILFECPCALLLIDLTKKDSFDSIKSLLNQITINNYPYLNFILVLNKSDLESEKEITDLELDEFINKNNCTRLSLCTCYQFLVNEIGLINYWVISQKKFIHTH